MSSLVLTRPFGWLWAGQAVSEVGSGISALAVPLLAVTVLHASPLQVALLPAIAGAAVLLAAPLGGVLADHLDQRRLLLVCDGARLLLVASVPAAVAVGALTLGHLYAVSAAVAAFSIAHHSFFPRLVAAQQLTAANGRIASTESLARVAGPAFGGALVAAVGASRALLADAVSFGVALVCVWRIRGSRLLVSSEPLAWRCALTSSVGAGFAIIRADAVLLRLVLSTLLGMGALSMSGAVIIVFLTRELQLTPAAVGTVFAAAQVVGITAALLTPRLARRWGSARLLVLTSAAAPAGYLVLLAEPSASLVLTAAPVVVFMAAWAARFVAFDVLQYTYRQNVCPPTHLSRLNASVRTLIGLVTTLGALAGGAFAHMLGSRASLVVASTLMCLATLPVLTAASLRRQRDLLDARTTLHQLTRPTTSSAASSSPAPPASAPPICTPSTPSSTSASSMPGGQPPCS